MSLINLKTDLKSLKYGRDTTDGGDSKLPLVKTPIPENFAEIGNTGGFDSTLRGGSLIGTAVVNDTIRIGKLINSTRTFQGASFKSKMNLLSRTNVKTQVDTQKYNQGEYQTRNTVAQVSADPFGTRFELFSGNLRYFDAVKDQQIGDNPTGRLIDYYNTKINTRTEGSELTSYDGGPGSTAGFGTTTIKLATDRTGINNSKLLDFYGRPGKPNPLFKELNTGDLLLGNESPNQQEPEFLTDPVQALGFSAFKRTPITSLNNLVFASGVTALLYNPVDNQASNFLKTAFKQSTLDSKLPGNNQGVLSSQKQILKQRQDPTNLLTRDDIDNIKDVDLYPVANKLQDFRLKVQDKNVKTVAGIREFRAGVSYNQTKRKTVLGDPGTKEKDYEGESAIANIGSNKVNLQPLYLSTDGGKTNSEKESAQTDPFIQFKIGIVSNNTSDGKSAVWVTLPAYINSFNDNFNGNWNDHTLLGRGEKFYTYSGFSRSISLSFIIHAQSVAERDVMYSKINYLASSLAPDYAGSGIMKGNFAILQVGSYLDQKTYGVIKNLTMTVLDNSPWDIDAQMPHMLEVSMTFEPIHDFIPQIKSHFIYGPATKNYIIPEPAPAKTTQEQENSNSSQNENSPENVETIKGVEIKVKRKQNKELEQLKGRRLQTQTVDFQPTPLPTLNFNR